MYRFACYLTLTAMIAVLFGCSMCCGPYDDDYNVFGGPLQRANPSHGRVGSALSDPYFSGYGPSSDSNLAPETSDSSGSDRKQLDFGSDTKQDDDRDYQKELEELRKELDLDAPEELPSPKPADDSETACSSQKSRVVKPQWR